MDGLADISLQLGDTEYALELLKQSTTQSPESNPIKWLFLAQLLNGNEALITYNIAINLLDKTKQTSNDEEYNQLLTKQIAKAYCSIAELYLTDLCFDDNAENLSEQAVNKAFDMIPNLIDAKQTLANIRLSQHKNEEACQLISQVYHTLFDIRNQLASRTVIDEIEGNDIETVEDSPESEFCITTAKILIECGSINPELIGYACELLNSLLQEDDENIELWYISGVAALTMKPPDIENARYYLENANYMMEKLQENCLLDGSTFPYNEQYVLLQDHFTILQDIEVSNNDGSKIVGKIDDKTIDNDMIVDNEDEEWSTCDEDEYN
eukprot:gene22640-29314_t